MLRKGELGVDKAAKNSKSFVKASFDWVPEGAPDGKDELPVGTTTVVP
jgi:hypothetical protein